MSSGIFYTFSQSLLILLQHVSAHIRCHIILKNIFNFQFQFLNILRSFCVWFGFDKTSQEWHVPVSYGTGTEFQQEFRPNQLTVGGQRGGHDMLCNPRPIQRLGNRASKKCRIFSLQWGGAPSCINTMLSDDRFSSTRGQNFSWSICRYMSLVTFWSRKNGP